MEPTNHRIVIFALPAAFLAAFASLYFPLTEIPLALWRVQTHEFGHATVAWFSGRKALPLFLGWTTVNPERSLFVYAAFAFLIGLAVYKCWDNAAWFPAGAGVVLLMVQLYCTFGLDPDQFEVLGSWGGIGGEFWISTLLVVSFHFKMPGRIRWDFFRWIALLLGAHAFLKQAIFWQHVSHHTASLPWGSLWGGASDSGGDMNRLAEAGWSDRDIIRSYLLTRNWCIAAMAGTYLAAVAWAWSRGDAADRAPARPPGDRRRYKPLPETAPAAVSSRSVYLRINDSVTGPMDSSQLPGLLAAGVVQMDTPCCVVGAAEWSTVRDFV